MPFQPSNYASTFLGGLNAASNKQQAAYGAAALRARARMKSAEKGIAMAEKEAARNRSNAFTNSLIGAFGNVASAGVSAAIKNSQAPTGDYTQFKPLTFDAISSPDSWNQNSQAVQGMYDQGFSYSQPYSQPVSNPFSAPVFKPSTSYFG